MGWSLYFDPSIPGDDPELRLMIEWFFDSYSEPVEEEEGESGEGEEATYEAFAELAARFPDIERERVAEAAALIENLARRWLGERREAA